MNRAAIESFVRLVITGIVGAGVVALPKDQQELAITSIAAIAWIVVSLWWSKKSDQKVKENA